MRKGNLMMKRSAIAAVTLAALLTGCGSSSKTQLKLLSYEHKIADIQKQEAELSKQYEAKNFEIQKINGEFPEIEAATKQANLDVQKIQAEFRGKVTAIYAAHHTDEKQVLARIGAIQAQQQPIQEQFKALDAQLKQAAADLQGAKES